MCSGRILIFEPKTHLAIGITRGKEANDSVSVDAKSKEKARLTMCR